MKKLVAILALCLTCVFCIIGFTACDKKTDNANQNKQQQEQGQTVQTMTKDGFFAELEAKEKATFAAADLHYDTVGCKYVESSYREINQEGTYAIIYNTDNNGHPYVYVLINLATGGGIQQQVLGLSTYLKDFLSYMPEQMLSDVDFKKDGDNLVFTLNADYPGSKIVAEYTFDKNGYLTYGAENSTIEGAGSNGFTFTATAYNKAAEQGGEDEQAVSLTKEEFLTWLEQAQTDTFNDESKHYATVSGTLVVKIGGNTDGTFNGTFALTYSIGGQDPNRAHAIVETSDSSFMGIDVLGSSDMIEGALTQYSDGELTIKQKGENIEVKFEFENEGHDMLIHYVYDKDGYVIYRLEQMDDGSVYKTEFTATAYNKAAEQGGENEQAVSLTKEEFLTWLEQAQTDTFNDESKHYDTVSGTYVREGSGNHDGTYTETFELTYETNIQGDGLAAATINYSDSARFSMQVLGLSQELTQILALAEAQGGDLEIKQVGPNIDLQWELNYNGTNLLAHYIFDSDGYYLYKLTQMGGNKDEFTATAYNRAEE